MRIGRILAATGMLAVAGALAGAVVGAGAMGAWLLVAGVPRGGIPWLFDAAVYGGICGALLGPPAAWMLMRHVPVGRAVGGAAAGTLASALAGLLLGGPGWLLSAGLLGFGVSVVALRFTAPRPGRRSLPSGERERLEP